MRYLLECINEQGTTYKINFEAVSLPDVMLNITDFLRGCGFAYLKEIDYETWSTANESDNDV